jgi:hypothetical protein
MPDRKFTKEEQMRIDHPWNLESPEPEDKGDSMDEAAESISSESVKEKYLEVADKIRKTQLLNLTQFKTADGEYSGTLFPDE